MIDNILRFFSDLRTATRSLTRVKGLSAAVILTLALGIGANAAVFTVLRGVLLRPLVNREESRLIYIRQTANGTNATFSVPEIQDLTSRLKTLQSFGDFSVVGFTLVGLGEPRTVRAGVVGGSYFQAMGLRPIHGRLLDASDDGPKAAGAVVLTYRFWNTLGRDPSVIGKTISLGSTETRTATIVGVLEPCVPYPQDTEIIANIVTSPHHLSATMVTGRIHRMTDLFARLAPGQDLESARAELYAVYEGMKKQHPEAYPPDSDFHVSAMVLRDELTAGARTVLIVLMGASLLVFLIACSNVANLILARSVRRENELAVRAALGARALDLRRVLFAEGLVLCVAGAGVGLLIAEPMVSILSRYASRFSVRALDLTIDSSMIWVAAGLAVLAAAVLAFVPRLPSSPGAQGLGLAAAGVRITNATNRRLRGFVLVQVAACFVLVAAAAATVNTLLSLESVRAAFDTRHVLAVNIPVMRDGRTSSQVSSYYREVVRQVRSLPGVTNVAVSSSVPWRDRQNFNFEFAVDGHVPAAGEKRPRANIEGASPALFATLGLPILAGRDFNDEDTNDSDPVAIVSQSLARQMFPNGDALNHSVLFTDPILQFASDPGMRKPRRIVGVVPDIDNSNFAPRPIMAIYRPSSTGGRLLVESHTDPYSLVQPITTIVRGMYANQPVERASTLEDIRTEVLSPERLNALISSVFAGVALLIAVVGVAGVLAFSVSARTREFGIRLAFGAAPRDLLIRVITEGASLAVAGLALGLACGFALARLAGSVIGTLKMPGVLPLAGAAVILLAAAAGAAAIPAARAASVDVMEALRRE